MLSIFLMILKVIGIILLIIVGLLLTLLLIVLLVPLRYKGQGSYYKQLEGTLKLSWLFHILSATISYHGEPEIIIKVFGFRILKKTDPPAEEFAEKAEDFPEEPMVSTQELKPPLRDPREEVKEDPKEVPKEEPEEDSKEDLKEDTQDVPQEAEKALPPKGGKKKLFKRLTGRIKEIFHRMLRFFKSLGAALKRADHLKEEWMEIIRDEENRKTFHLVMRQGKKVLHHLLPVKLKGRIVFGFEDPYTTGQILSGAALLYPVYRDNFTLLPVFDQEIIEGELSFKGRIRLCVFLIAGLKVLLNKNFRVQFKKIMNRGGM